VARSELFVGRFGRMFRALPAFEPSDELIEELAARMHEEAEPRGDNGDGQEERSPSDNPEIPAGFTYVGQFLDHDLTFDPASSLQHRNDPNALTDFRTARLDLDSVYGSGPADQPYLYDTADTVKLLIGRNPAADEDGNALEPRDLPRNQQHRALIGDKRNDENTIVSQLQLTFLDFHNQVVDDIRAGALDEALVSDDVFAEAQRLVRWHYQWAIAFDFLPRIVGHELVDRLIKTERRSLPGGRHETISRFAPEHQFYRVKEHPFMPVEFSVAAYRYGHSQIRPEYDLNDAFENVPIFVEHPETAPSTGHLGGFRALPAGFTIDWARFFDLGGEAPEKSRLIDTRLAIPMTKLPANIASDGTDGKSLALFNLRRGKMLGLPSGQAVARAIGAHVLTASELDIPGRGQAPLWYYVLKEAEVQHNGRHLGQAGGRIVAEVVLALIALDRHSFLAQDPAFHPVIERADPATFTFADLVTHAVQQRGAVPAGIA
jgi:hypothetical protein